MDKGVTFDRSGTTTVQRSGTRSLCLSPYRRSGNRRVTSPFLSNEPWGCTRIVKNTMVTIPTVYSDGKKGEYRPRLTYRSSDQKRNSKRTTLVLPLSHTRDFCLTTQTSDGDNDG